jgi:outer membrane protein assembly factor BamB
MKATILIIVTLLTGLMACGDHSMPPDVPTPVQDTIFELLWATELKPGDGIISTDFTQHYKDWVLVTGDLDLPPTISAFNKKTGNKDWEYIHQGAVNNEIDISVIYENIYIAICSHGLVAVDLNKQESIWELDFYPLDYYRENSNTIFDGFLYLNIQIGGAGLDANSAAILKINIKTGEHEKIFEVKKQGENLTSLSPPTIWPNSDTNQPLIIFNEYPNAQKPPQDDEQNIVALDLTTKEVVWRTKKFTENFYSSGLHPPIIYKDIVITGGDWSIYAFDVKTGKQLWRHAFDYHTGIWTKTNHLIYDDRLYVNNSQHDVTCLNPETGELIWNNPRGGANCTDNMLYYEKEDYLIFTSWGYGSVMILDAFTGKTIHQEEQYENSNYNNDVVYDKDLDMFFTSTYKHAIGFKVNAPK